MLQTICTIKHKELAQGIYGHPKQGSILELAAQDVAEGPHFHLYKCKRRKSKEGEIY